MCSGHNDTLCMTVNSTWIDVFYLTLPDISAVLLNGHFDLWLGAFISPDLRFNDK